MNPIKRVLLESLKDRQKDAVESPKRLTLVVAGAGSGKTEVMARKVAWWTAVDGVPKDSIVAFTFTERAAEEMKFRIRRIIEKVTPKGEEPTLGSMYVGTIHGFCLKLLREIMPDQYHNYEVIDEAARLALVQRGFNGAIGLSKFQEYSESGYFNAIGDFLHAYDLLNEYDELQVKLPPGPVPHALEDEREWCKRAKLGITVGRSKRAKAFAEAAARYYAYLHCRRFLDFSTCQSELLKVLRRSAKLLGDLRKKISHVVVDEVQDLNPVQDAIVRTLVGESGTLMAVGDHRQAIYGFRASKVEIMGKLHQQLQKSREGRIVELQENFRSTPRIIALANSWARTIGPVRSMGSPDMNHGDDKRTDTHPSHLSAVHFESREQEAAWMAQAILKLVPTDKRGAAHKTKGGERGITFSDVAVLLRSGTRIHTYMEAFVRAGIPAVFKAGPDLFAKPEVLLFVAALAKAAGVNEFMVSGWNERQFGNRIMAILESHPSPDEAIISACEKLRAAGLPLKRDAADRLILAAELIQNKLAGEPPPKPRTLERFRSPGLKQYLVRGDKPRRVFPQQLYQLLLAEAEVGEWDGILPGGESAMFHLGQLSSLLTGIETPGWTRTDEFKFQIIGLCMWGAENARTEAAPLLVQPDAVTVGTIHSAKGLEFGAVFVGDVCPLRFPSNMAKRIQKTPFEGRMLDRIDPADLADNDNYDAERRLMYVALTRAERYLFVTGSSKKKPSKFFSKVAEDIQTAGGTAVLARAKLRLNVSLKPSSRKRDDRLVTSFSDLRYYLGCSHDFYLRKVLGFAPTIDQAFGYGKGVHNVLRAIHSDPKQWAALAKDGAKLKRKLEDLVQSGMFYLRHTTGQPAVNMRNKAVETISEYIKVYSDELKRLKFESEREFETLIPEENVLVNGAIDVVRLDNPPRVTIIDFKSGDPSSDARMKLDEEEMRLQVSLYGLAAKKELEYDPERGLVRYLGGLNPENAELSVDLRRKNILEARRKVTELARAIKGREFHSGPSDGAGSAHHPGRCVKCDFLPFCGMKPARIVRKRQGNLS